MITCDVARAHGRDMLGQCLRARGGGGGGSGALGASGGAAARIESWPGANWAQRSDFRS